MIEVNPKPLGAYGGIVELDETYMGGKKRYVGRGSLEGKTMVLGSVERGGSHQASRRPPQEVPTQKFSTAL